MPNKFLPSSLISHEAAAILKVENTFLATANRKFEGMFSGQTYKPGDSVNVRLDNFFTGSRGDVSVAEAVTEASIAVEIQPLFTVSVSYTPTDLTRKIEDFGAEILAPGIRRLSAMLNEAIYTAALTEVNHFTGAASANLNTFASLDEVNPIMDDLAIDSVYARYAALAPIEVQQLRSASTLQNSFLPMLNRDITMHAALGNLADFDIYKDQSVGLFTAGTHADSGGGISVKTAASSGSTLVLTGLTNGTTFVAGDVIEIAGVFGFNPILRKSTGETAKFTVTTGGTVASNDVTLTVFPSLSFSGQRQNFTSASSTIPAGAAVTVYGDHVANLCYSDQGLIACLPPLAPMDAPESSVATDKEYGISIRCTKTADVLANRNILRLDLQAAYKWVPDQAVRLISKGKQ